MPDLALLIAIGISTATGMLVGDWRRYRRDRIIIRNLVSASIRSTTIMGNAAASLLVEALKIDGEAALQKLINRCKEYGMNPVAFTPSKEMRANVSKTK